MIPLHLLPAPIASDATSFLGIQWGASPHQATCLMLQRRGVSAAEAIDDATLGFDGGFFAGSDGARYQLGFIDGGFRYALVCRDWERDIW